MKLCSHQVTEVKLGNFVELSYISEEGQATVGIMEVVELFEDIQVLQQISCAWVVVVYICVSACLWLCVSVCLTEMMCMHKIPFHEGLHLTRGQFGKLQSKALLGRFLGCKYGV